MPFSNKKMVVSGNTVETYLYERNYMYGFTYDVKTKKPRRKRDVQEFDISNLIRTKRAVRRLLAANGWQYKASDGSVFKPVFITFTFRDDVVDLTQANKSFTSFIRFFNRDYFKQDGYLKYLGVPEIQYSRESSTGFGVWHYHVVFFNLPFVPRLYDRISEYWGNGFCFVGGRKKGARVINDLNHLSNYVTKYLTKTCHELRLFGRKKYLCSKGLFRSSEVRSPDLVDLVHSNYLSHNPLFTSEFFSAHDHQRIRYIKHSVDSNSSLKDLLGLVDISQ